MLVLLASTSKSLLKLLVGYICLCYPNTHLISVGLNMRLLIKPWSYASLKLIPRLNEDRRLMPAYDPQTRKNNREAGCLKQSRLRRWINKTIFSTSKSNEGIGSPIPERSHPNFGRGGKLCCLRAGIESGIRARRLLL